MLFQWDIENIIKEATDRHNLNIDYKHENHLLTPMSFNVRTSTIKYNHMQINGYKTKCKIKMDDETFCKIVLYHEIGHFLDFKNNKEKISLSERENNAWEYGRKLIHKDLLRLYDKVRKLDNR